MKQCSWSSCSVEELSKESFSALLNDEIPAIRISMFAEISECEILADLFLNCDFEQMQWNMPTIQRFGPSYSSYLDDKERYFELARHFTQKRREICSAAFDPVERFMHVMNQKAGIVPKLAEEKDFGIYYAGSVKRRGGDSSLHMDTSEHMKEWSIGKVHTHLAFNVYFQIPERGSKTVVYNRQWQKEDDRFMDEQENYNKSVIENCQCAVVENIVGEAVLINSTNFHQVISPENETRVSMGFFMGINSNENLIFWS